MIVWENITWFHYIILIPTILLFSYFLIPLIWGISKALVEEVPKDMDKMMKDLNKFWSKKNKD